MINYAGNPITGIKDLFELYEEFCSVTAQYPDLHELEYTALGLVNEAGEVAGVVKKRLRGDNLYSNGILPTEKFYTDLKSELGDVLWYLVRLANSNGISFKEVLIYNRDKLQDRLNRDAIKGNGDNR